MREGPILGWRGWYATDATCVSDYLLATKLSCQTRRDCLPPWRAYLHSTAVYPSVYLFVCLGSHQVQCQVTSSRTLWVRGVSPSPRITCQMSHPGIPCRSKILSSKTSSANYNLILAPIPCPSYHIRSSHLPNRTPTVAFAFILSVPPNAPLTTSDPTEP